MQRNVSIAAVVLSLTFCGAAETFAATAGDLQRLRERALELVNQSRDEHELPPLDLGVHANEAAQMHAEDMLEREYYSHTSPEGETVRDRYLEAGGSKWRLTAENIARCAGCNAEPDIDAMERLHDGWMQSPEHRKNILRRGMSTFGYGIIASEDQGLYAVQTFAGPGTPRDLQPDEQATALAANEQVQVALRRINRAREEAGEDDLVSSESLARAVQTILPQQGTQPFDIQMPANLSEALPGDARKWRSLSMLTAACGGCGTEPTEADIRYFIAEWLDHPEHRQTLLRSGATHLGFAVAANGEGKKTAVGVLGHAR